MKRLKTSGKMAAKTGKAPGTIEYIGNTFQSSVQFHQIVFEHKKCENYAFKTLDDLLKNWREKDPQWVIVYGLHDSQVIAELGKRMDIHPLFLEDVANTAHLPKAELWNQSICLILKYLRINADKELDPIQIAIIQKGNTTVCFTEGEIPIWDTLKDRFFKSEDPPFPLEAMIDYVLDQSFPILHAVGIEIENLGTAMGAQFSKPMYSVIENYRRELIRFRNLNWYTSDAVRKLSQILEDTGMVKNDRRDYLINDCLDHLKQADYIIEQLSGEVQFLFDRYSTLLNNNINIIMKRLTIYTTVFLPLMFLSGLYGMNFDNMPGLRWEWGYSVMLVVMLLTSGSTYFYFIRKKWL